jgi:hypothetical protein
VVTARRRALVRLLRARGMGDVYRAREAAIALAPRKRRARDAPQVVDHL